MKCKGILFTKNKVDFDCPLKKTCKNVHLIGEPVKHSYIVKDRSCKDYIPTEDKNRMFKKIRLETASKRYTLLAGTDNIIIKSIPHSNKLIGKDVVELSKTYANQLKFSLLSESESDKIYEDNIEPLIAKNKSIGYLIDKFDLEV